MRIILMKKFTFLILIAGIFLNFSDASARLRSLTEWNGGMPGSLNSDSYDGYSPEGMEEGGAGTTAIPLTAEQYCPKICPGYKTETEECPEGYELKSCSDIDCGKYLKCQRIICEEGYDTTFKDCPISVQDDNYHCTKCIQ